MTEFLSAGDVVNVVLAIVGWTIKRELSHIKDSIDHVREVVADAKRTADKAHERLDQFILDAKMFP